MLEDIFLCDELHTNDANIQVSSFRCVANSPIRTPPEPHLVQASPQGQKGRRDPGLDRRAVEHREVDRRRGLLVRGSVGRAEGRCHRAWLGCRRLGWPVRGAGLVRPAGRRAEGRQGPGIHPADVGRRRVARGGGGGRVGGHYRRKEEGATRPRLQQVGLGVKETSYVEKSAC